MKFFAVLFALVLSCACAAKLHAQAVEPPGGEETVAADTPAAPAETVGKPVMITVKEFGPGAIKGAIKKLQELKAQGHSEIWVRINTNGGSVAGLMDLSQAMEELGQPVTCVVDWHGYSAGAFLLESPGCSKRLMTKRSTILFHEGQTSSQGSIHDLARSAAMLKAITDAIVDQTSERMGMTEAAFQAKIDNKEWTMDYKEAKAAKAIDDIVSPLKLPPNVDFPVPNWLEMLFGD
jgi:ATP-dependent protease ClpP protease subunit